MTPFGSTRFVLSAALGLAALGAVTGLAFAGWMEHAPGIFMAMVESGMARGF